MAPGIIIQCILDSYRGSLAGIRWRSCNWCGCLFSAQKISLGDDDLLQTAKAKDKICACYVLLEFKLFLKLLIEIYVGILVCMLTTRLKLANVCYFVVHIYNSTHEISFTVLSL